MPQRVRALLGTVAALATLIALPVAAQAPQPGAAKRIVWMGNPAGPGAQRRACFAKALASLGWIEGRSIAIDNKPARGARAEDLLEAAEEAARLQPALVVAPSTPVAQVVKRAIRDIPVVFVMVSDPVASGIVRSLARPEGNVTGVSNFLPATTAKLLEFAKDLAPAAKRVAFLHDPDNPGKRLELEVLRKAAPARGMVIEPLELRLGADADAAFAPLMKSPPDALVVPTDGVTTAWTQRIVALAAKLRRPAIYQTRDFVEAGGLLSYGLDACAHYGRAAFYVDKVLKGAKPADLPVELPSTFELVINLKTARALGVQIPPSVLARAARVIE